ncbi:MAG: hypothetical protein ABIS47_09280 [Acidimicrobiales bacterium]
MPGSEDDLGLDLRLPWGRPNRQEAARTPELPPTEPAPAAAQAPAPAAVVAVPATVRDGSARTDELRRSLEGLLFAVESRFDQLDARLDAVDGAVPERLKRIEGRLVALQRALVEAVEQPSAPTVNLVETVGQGVALATHEIEARLGRLETLVMAAHATTMEAIGEIALAPPSDEPGPDDGELLARFERLEALVVASHAPTLEAVGELASAGAAPSPDSRLHPELLVRLERLEALVLASHASTLEAVELASAGDPVGTEASARADPPELLHRLERLESLLDASHSLTLDALSQMAPAHVVSRLEQRLEVVDAGLRGRLDQVKARIDAAQAATMEAVSELAPAHLVTTLIEGVVATGEMLDEELLDLRRLLADHGPTPSSPRA